MNSHITRIGDKTVATTNPYENNHENSRTCISENSECKLTIPAMIVTYVYRALCQMNQTGTRRLGGINGKIIKLSAAIIPGTRTYNMC